MTVKRKLHRQQDSKEGDIIKMSLVKTGRNKNLKS